MKNPLWRRLSSLVLVLCAVFFVSVCQVTSQQVSLKQLTFSDSTHDGYPYWSPDARYIIYSSGTRTGCTTMKIPAAGGTSVRMTECFSQHAQWSPAGGYIAFDGDFGTRLYLSSVEGGVPVRIVPEQIPIARSGMPCWSPDGTRIAFRSGTAVWLLHLTSGDIARIFQPDSALSIPFCWTHDGKCVLTELMDTVTRSSDIWIVPVGGGEPRQLTFLDGSQKKPSISPDDSLVVFTSNHGGNYDLWMIPYRGGIPEQLTFSPGDKSNPGHDLEASWSPDGRRIAFSSTRSGYWAIWVMEVDLEYFAEKFNRR